jgi:hypothetical protein
MLEMFKLQRKVNSGIASFLFAFFIWLTWSQGSVAQAAQKHQIGLDTGYAYYQSRDLYVSPLMYSGGQQPFALSYLYKGTKNRHYLRLSYSNGQLKSSAGNLIVADLRFSFQYGYQRYLAAPLNENTKLFAGFLWNSFASDRENTFIITEQLHHSVNSGELISSLHFSISGEYNINERNEMAFQATFPVLTRVFRSGLEFYTGLGPPSYWEIIKAGHVVTVNEYRQIDTTLSYERLLSNHLNLRVAYQFTFYRFPKPRKTATVENEIRIGGILKI